MLYLFFSKKFNYLKKDCNEKLKNYETIYNLFLIFFVDFIQQFQSNDKENINNQNTEIIIQDFESLSNNFEDAL